MKVSDRFLQDVWVLGQWRSSSSWRRRNAFVVQRHWLDERAYADLLALCQFLLGPASSQVGFSIGLMRAALLSDAASMITGVSLPIDGGYSCS